MKRDEKRLLFEMMEKVNPDFKNIEEVQQKMSPDAAFAQKTTTQTVQRANARIDTPQEFQDWFQTIFATTGFDPQKKTISISQVQTLVKNAMINLGYK